MAGTEPPIQRPKDPKRRKTHYNGNKKCHTLKNIVVAKRLPKGSKLLKDSGFQGYEPPGVRTCQPKKKPPQDEFTPEEQAANQELAREQVVVEHAIGAVNVFHIVRDVYRNHRAGFDDLVFETACGLHNFRCDYRLSRAA